MFERAALEGSARSRAFRLALDVGFGDSAAQASAMTRLASEDYGTVRYVRWILLHPRYRQNVGVARMLVQRAYDDEVGGAPGMEAFTSLSYYGRFQELLDLLEDPRIDTALRSRVLYDIRAQGFPVPIESLEEALGSISIDSIADPSPILRVGLSASREPVTVRS